LGKLTDRELCVAREQLPGSFAAARLGFCFDGMFSVTIKGVGKGDFIITNST